MTTESESEGKVMLYSSSCITPTPETHRLMRFKGLKVVDVPYTLKY